MDRPLDLTFEEGGVDRLADVMGGDHLPEPPVLVQHHDLDGPPVGEVGHWMLDVGPRWGRVIERDRAPELLPGQILDAAAVERRPQLLGGVDHGQASEDGGARRRGLPGVELALGVHDHVYSLRREPEFLAGDLAERGVHPLAHLGPGVVQRHRAVGLRPQDRFAVLGQPVPDPRVLHAAPDPRERGAAIRIAHRLQACLDPDARPEHLAGAEGPAHVERVPVADLPPVNADAFGETVQHAVDRERHLVHAEPAHRPARGVVRVDGTRLDVDVGDLVRPARVPGRALQHLVADARVRSRVPDDAGPQRREPALRVGADRVVHHHRVALRMEPEALRARQDEQRRASRRVGEQRRVALHVQVFLGAERPAVRDLGHADPRLGHRQERGDLATVLPYALALRVHVVAVSVGHGERRLWLEERVLDRLGPERLAQDVRRRGQRGVDVASPHDRGREQIVALVHRGSPVVDREDRVGHRLEHLVLHLDQGRSLARAVTALGRHDREDVAHVGGDLSLGHELAPVPRDQALGPLARHVGRRRHRDDTRMGRRSGDVDPQHPRPGVVGEPDRPVDHVRREHVGDVRLVAERELDALVPRRSGPHAVADGRRRHRLAPALPSDPVDRVDHLHVARASAQVAGEAVRDLLAGRGRLLRQQTFGLHHDPRRAEAALRGPGGHERIGPTLAHVIGQALLRHDLAALRVTGGLCARDAGPAVHEHGAGAARSLGRAAVLHGGHPEALAEHVEEGLAVADVDRDGSVVQREVHDHLLLVPILAQTGRSRFPTPPPRAPATAAPSASRPR